MSMIKLLEQEFSGWKKAELLWLFFCTVSVTALSLYMKDTALRIVTAVTGLLYTLLAGKGKISCYFFGIVNVLGYSFISYCNDLHGEVMLNMLCYLPMMFIGIFCWKNQRDASGTIYKTWLGAAGETIMLLLSGAGIIIYALILKKLGDPQPVVDSITTVLSVSAMILTVKRCIEQWALWTAVNALSIYMWLVQYLRGEGSFAILCMWILALLNGIIFFCQWYTATAKGAGAVKERI